jgi:hypothetical protein
VILFPRKGNKESQKRTIIMTKSEKQLNKAVPSLNQVQYNYLPKLASFPPNSHFVQPYSQLWNENPLRVEGCPELRRKENFLHVVPPQWLPHG